MFTTIITPSFMDIDCLGHANNTASARWFELVRTKTTMRLLNPELEITNELFPFILAHTEYDFVNQVYLQSDVEVKTWISRIGTKSFTVSHEAFQNGRLCIKGNAVVVYYDFDKKETIPIPDDKRKLLEEHLAPNITE